jgi:EAL domain-containing protein (putative c-di-GMP-specific phosphodiesterase class I)
MLLTLVYRSQISSNTQLDDLDNMVAKASMTNSQSSVTGILLHDDSHFFQLLEGPEETVDSIFAKIATDKRHNNVVELMRDHAPSRRFGKVGMEIFDLRTYSEDVVFQAVLDKGTSKYRLTYDDRALQFLSTFVQAREKENYLDIPSPDAWSFVVDHSQSSQVQATPSAECSYAFQPVVDPLTKQIVSFVATLCDPQGGSPLGYYARSEHKNIYTADLESKRQAFAMASEFGMGDKSLTISLLPMTLSNVPNAVEFLVQEIAACGLIPEQVVIALSENGAITAEEPFHLAVKKLKASGLRLAVENFGAGSAGLLQLTQMQPDKLMIEPSLIHEVHKNGPKQAIILSIIKFCTSLEISLTATGVEQVEEWMWLEAAGICHFQGSLFAKPGLNRLPLIAWPEIVGELAPREKAV